MNLPKAKNFDYIGTIYERTKTLLSARIYMDKPIWYKLYPLFPPIRIEDNENEEMTNFDIKLKEKDERVNNYIKKHNYINSTVFNFKNMSKEKESENQSRNIIINQIWKNS